jgi:hypothetical protein
VPEAFPLAAPDLQLAPSLTQGAGTPPAVKRGGVFLGVAGDSTLQPLQGKILGTANLKLTFHHSVGANRFALASPCFRAGFLVH